MRVSFASIAVSLSLASSAFAIGCFSGGASADCSSVISQFCNQETTTTFDAGETRSQCFNVGAGTKCQMTIQNPANNQATLAAGDCISANTATNGGCNSNGGIRSQFGFDLTVDPNAGSC